MTGSGPVHRTYPSARGNDTLAALGVTSRWNLERSSTTFEFDIEEGVARLELCSEGAAGGTRLVAHGESAPVQKALRSLLLGQAKLTAEPIEHHWLRDFQPSTPYESIIRVITSWVDYLRSESMALSLMKKGEGHPHSDPVHAFWWDIRSNFGDVIGPWLISAYTGRKVVNARFMKNPGRTLVSVGSVIQMIKRPGADIWGSGLIREINDKHRMDLERLQGVRVHAVRGRQTRDQLVSQLGWEVPEVYGDPALLLPRVYRPDSDEPAKSQISFVPHYAHRKWLGSLNTHAASVIDVRDDLTTVVTKIAASRACISTSLHGLIIAQAYGVPWVWLNVIDETLAGARFKFDDYFSTLETPSVAEYQITTADITTLDLTEIAQRATLPKLRIDLDALEQAFPIQPLAD